MKRILLLRHCTSSGQEPEANLAPEGYQQAQKLVSQLGDYSIDLLISSPYQRAVESITPFANSRGLDIRTDPRLAERTISEHRIDNWMDYIKGSYNDPELAAPTGESANDVIQRAWPVIQSAFESDFQLPLLSTHGQWISLVLNSIDPTFGFEGWQQLRNPDLIELSADQNGRVSFHKINLDD